VTIETDIEQGNIDQMRGSMKLEEAKGDIKICQAWLAYIPTLP